MAEAQSTGEPASATDKTTLTVAETRSDGEEAAVRRYFNPLFAGTGGIDSWLGAETPPSVCERLSRLSVEPLGRAQLSQLLILSHEAGPGPAFFAYYWLRAPGDHPYDVTDIGLGQNTSFSEAWLTGTQIVSIAHLKWGLYRFYVDALLFFGNVRSAYRSLRDLDMAELEAYFTQRRFDTQSLRERGPALPLHSIAKDDRYLVAEMACKSLQAGQATDVEAVMLEAYRTHVNAGGSPLVSVEDLLKGQFVAQHHGGRQAEFIFSADDILRDTVGTEDELIDRFAVVRRKFEQARQAALENTRLYLSMVSDLDVYVATSMRTRDNFRRMATFCEEVFNHPDLDGLHLRYFDPTLSAADSHVDKGLIECLMVDAAKVLVYYAGDRESMGKDFEAAMALSRGKPVIVFCEDKVRERLYRDIHPLTRLIEFDTGVAIGAMVTTNIKSVRDLLQRILTNSMKYGIKKTEQGALHLTEDITSCLVRLQTHDTLLQETFWNYYHRKNVLA